jgi:hypothetical protein
MIPLDSIPVALPGLCVRELGDTIIIISEQGDALHSLDELGSFIWHELDRGASVGEIAGRICGAYEVDPARAREDLLKFLAALQEKNLISLQTK